MITRDNLVKLIKLKEQLDSASAKVKTHLSEVWFESDILNWYLLERTVALLNPELYDWLLWYWYDRPRAEWWDWITFQWKEYLIKSPKTFANFLIKECIAL